MSDQPHRAVVVEVFPMRLGGEVLLDVTLEPTDEKTFPEPRPNDFLVLPGGEELRIWAAPKIAHPKGALRLNVQFQAAEVTEVAFEEGMTVEFRAR